MPSFTPVVLLCVTAFLLGAIPFGFLMGRLKGIDIREHGSKNIGATNVLRLLGKGPAAVVFLLDALKGFLPVFAAMLVIPHPSDEVRVAVGISAVLGHIYSPYVRFRGGKGVATALGVLLGLNWIVAGIAFVVFFATVCLTRYVSLGSILGALVQGVLFWVLPHQGPALPLFGTVVGTFVIIRHRANIARLRAGTESKWGQKSATEATESVTGVGDGSPG
jgi:acyl phosphate:glycerol-3-phosphate acyltransferase